MRLAYAFLPDEMAMALGKLPGLRWLQRIYRPAPSTDCSDCSNSGLKHVHMFKTKRWRRLLLLVVALLLVIAIAIALGLGSGMGLNGVSAVVIGLPRREYEVKLTYDIG